MNLHVYVGDGYSFFITVDSQQQIAKAMVSIEQQLNYLYQASGKLQLLGLFDDRFNDLPPTLLVRDAFSENAPAICLLNLAQPTEGAEQTISVIQVWPNPASQQLNAVSISVSATERQ